MVRRCESNCYACRTSPVELGSLGWFSRVALLRGNAPTARRISVSESLGGASFGLSGFFLTVFWRSCGFERTQQPRRDPCHFLDRSQECGLVRLRRLSEAADLSYKLERRRPNLVIGDRRIEIE